MWADDIIKILHLLNISENNGIVMFKWDYPNMGFSDREIKLIKQLPNGQQYINYNNDNFDLTGLGVPFQRIEDSLRQLYLDNKNLLNYKSPHEKLLHERHLKIIKYNTYYKNHNYWDDLINLKTDRNTLWHHWNGIDVKGMCSLCGGEINITNFEAGHIISRNDGGSDSLYNLTTLCMSCNRSLGSKNLCEFIKKKLIYNLFI